MKNTNEEKSLQNFTDFEEIKNAQDVKDFLEKQPEEVDDLLSYFQKKINQSYTEKSGKESDIANMMVACYRELDEPNEVNYVRNITYEINHTLISSFIHNYVLNNNCFPTTNVIMDKTGLSRQTVYNHLKTGLMNQYRTLIKGKTEYMVTSALERLYSLGIQGDVSALKSYIQLAGQNNCIVNNYIQINNIKIEESMLKNLPEEKLNEIINIINSESKTINVKSK